MANSSTSTSTQPTVVETAFQARTDLQAYAENARMLFALQLKFQIEDIVTVATNYLTAGADDCKCDLVYIDQDSGVAVIAQAYECSNLSKKSAPANKAAALSTAVTWLLSVPLKQLPSDLRPAAQELRRAVASKSIKTLQLWYVHNLPESRNVAAQLAGVEHTAAGVVQKTFGGDSLEEIVGMEVGRQTLSEWYQALSTPILVNDEFEFSIKDGYAVSGTNWEAYSTAVPARWLYEIFRVHKDKLFSANLRGYLGSRKSDANINHGIKTTAQDNPGQFWVFNNGITALVHDFDTNGKGKLKITGISIVNGAQTTGAIGSLKQTPKAQAMVNARFVKCADSKTVEEIITYNNSQNQIEASDFRSNDVVQKRLRMEFDSIPNSMYHGCRRGGHQDFIRRPGNVIPSDTAAQALAAFHGNPVTAYNHKSQIWLFDELYARYFNEETSAAHIVFVYSLLRCIQQTKLTLQREFAANNLKQSDLQSLDFLKRRGASFLLVAAIAACIETFMDCAVPNSFRLSFSTKTSPAQAEKIWEPIVEVVLPFHQKLLPGVESSLASPEEAKKSIGDFISMVEATKKPMMATYKKFAAKVHSSF